MCEPRALTELIPDWKEKGAPLDTPVTDDAFLFLSQDKSLKLPNFLLPPEQVRLLARSWYTPKDGVLIFCGLSASTTKETTSSV